MNIEKYRNETPGTSKVIHFNNAGASLIPTPVYDKVRKYQEYELSFGGYETAEKYRKSLNGFYTNIANLINADPASIAFMESATHAWDMAFFSIPFKKDDVILTSRIEYASNYIAYLQLHTRYGVHIKPVRSTNSGELDLEDLEKKIDEGNVRLISVTHMPTNGGTVNPIEEIGEIAQKHGILYLVDACQSAGQYPIDVKKIGCHYLSATGRKYMRGPRGTGFLYVNPDILEEIEPWTLDLHSAEWISPTEFKVVDAARKYEKWECNPAAKLGLSEAARYCAEIGIHNIWIRIQELAEKLRRGLNDLDGIEVLDLGAIKSGIVTFRSKLLKPSKMKIQLAFEKINTTEVVASSTLLDMTDRSIDSAVRASVHYFNTEEEISAFLKTLEQLQSSIK